MVGADGTNREAMLRGGVARGVPAWGLTDAAGRLELPVAGGDYSHRATPPWREQVPRRCWLKL
jgi:hypothetical protein